MRYVYHIAFSYSVGPRSQPGIMDNSPPRTNFGDTTVTLNRQLNDEVVLNEVRLTIRNILEAEGANILGVTIINWKLLSTEGE